MIGVSRGVHTIGEIREKVFLCCSKGSGDSVAGLVVFAPGMVLPDRVKQGDHSFIKFLISYKAMQKSSLAPTPSISYALHNFGCPDREFQALLYYVPFLPVNLTLFPPTGFVWSQGRRGRYIQNVGGIKIRRSGVPRAYQEEIGSTGPAPET